MVIGISSTPTGIPNWGCSEKVTLFNANSYHDTAQLWNSMTVEHLNNVTAQLWNSTTVGLILAGGCPQARPLSG